MTSIFAYGNRLGLNDKSLLQSYNDLYSFEKDYPHYAWERLIHQGGVKRMSPEHLYDIE